MSLRSPRGRRKALRAARGPALGAVLFGAAAAIWGGTLTPSSLPDSTRWQVLTPGLAEGLADPNPDRQIRVAEGALVLSHLAFGRAQRLTPKSDPGLSRLEVSVLSGQVALIWRQSEGHVVPFCVTPDGASPGSCQLQDGAAQTSSEAGGAALLVEEGHLYLRGSSWQGAPTGPGSFEILAHDREARVGRLVGWGQDGQLLWDEDFTATDSRTPRALAGALTGALVSGALGGLGLLIPPAMALAPDSTQWMTLTTLLYLGDVRAHSLAWLALLAALGASLATALSRHPRLEVRPGQERPSALWLWVPTTSAVLASFHDGAWSATVLGAFILASPWFLAWRAPLDGRSWCARDLPALVSVAVLGWIALLPAALWRLVPLAASSRALRLSSDASAQAGASALLLTLVLVPPATEISARSSRLDTDWDADRLAIGQTPTSASADGPGGFFWQDRCGPEDATRVHSIAVLGGSATGGAYQLRDDPEAFFSALVHAALCEQLPQETALTTWNLGASGLATHDIARDIPGLVSQIQPDLLVLYVGTNDLLTRLGPLTRRQQDQATAATPSLGQLARHSRVLTGGSLLLRGTIAASSDTRLVSAVPLPDAEENLRTIVAANQGRPVLAVAQHINRSEAARLEPYWALEAQLAQELEALTALDPRSVLASQGESLLVDRNHLSRTGHHALATQITPVAGALLGLEGAPP